MVTGEELLPTQPSKKRCLWIIMGVLFLYILENTTISKIVGYSLFTYGIKPLIWLSMAYMIWYFPNIRPMGKLKYRSLINLWAFNFATIYIIVLVMAGLFIDGMGKSPYSHTPLGIISNIYLMGTALVGREFVRNYLVNNLSKRENYLILVAIAFFMTITDISINKFLNLDGLEGTVQFLSQDVAPGFSENLLTTYLVSLAGPMASIIYMGIVLAFQWLSPILPNLKWITKALIGVLLPIFYLMSIQSIYFQATKEVKVRESDKESPISWIITSVISICIVWFSVGVFPIYPSVIATGSMEPLIKPGDVILVKKVVDMEGINGLKTGDIIQFRRDSILISHRIIEVKNGDEGLRFCTQGDNNSGPDSELVKPEDIKGAIVYVIPKIGWPTLMLKSEQDIPLEEIVF